MFISISRDIDTIESIHSVIKVQGWAMDKKSYQGGFKLFKKSCEDIQKNNNDTTRNAAAPFSNVGDQSQFMLSVKSSLGVGHGAEANKALENIKPVKGRGRGRGIPRSDHNVQIPGVLKSHLNNNSDVLSSAVSSKNIESSSKDIETSSKDIETLSKDWEIFCNDIEASSKDSICSKDIAMPHVKELELPPFEQHEKDKETVKVMPNLAESKPRVEIEGDDGWEEDVNTDFHGLNITSQQSTSIVKSGHIQSGGHQSKLLPRQKVDTKNDGLKEQHINVRNHRGCQTYQEDVKSVKSESFESDCPQRKPLLSVRVKHASRSLDNKRGVKPYKGNSYHFQEGRGYNNRDSVPPPRFNRRHSNNKNLRKMRYRRQDDNFQKRSSNRFLNNEVKEETEYSPGNLEMKTPHERGKKSDHRKCNNKRITQMMFKRENDEKENSISAIETNVEEAYIQEWDERCEFGEEKHREADSRRVTSNKKLVHDKNASVHSLNDNVEQLKIAIEGLSVSRGCKTHGEKVGRFSVEHNCRSELKGRHDIYQDKFSKSEDTASQELNESSGFLAYQMPMSPQCELSPGIDIFSQGESDARGSSQSDATEFHGGEHFHHHPHHASAGYLNYTDHQSHDHPGKRYYQSQMKSAFHHYNVLLHPQYQANVMNPFMNFHPSQNFTPRSYSAMTVPMYLFDSQQGMESLMSFVDYHRKKWEEYAENCYGHCTPLDFVVSVRESISRSHPSWPGTNCQPPPSSGYPLFSNYSNSNSVASAPATYWPSMYLQQSRLSGQYPYPYYPSMNDPNAAEHPEEQSDNIDDPSSGLEQQLQKANSTNDLCCQQDSASCKYIYI